MLTLCVAQVVDEPLRSAVPACRQAADRRALPAACRARAAHKAPGRAGEAFEWLCSSSPSALRGAHDPLAPRLHTRGGRPQPRHHAAQRARGCRRVGPHPQPLALVLGLHFALQLRWRDRARLPPPNSLAPRKQSSPTSAPPATSSPNTPRRDHDDPPAAEPTSPNTPPSRASRPSGNASRASSGRSKTSSASKSTAPARSTTCVPDRWTALPRRLHRPQPPTRPTQPRPHQLLRNAESIT